MKEIDLIQNTPEWHEFRRHHLGASEAASVLGLSKFKSLEDLWKQKIGLGEEQEQNEHMRRGVELEPIVRIEVMRDLKVELNPAVFESDEYNFISASVDGISPDRKTVIEIKCAGKKDHESARMSIVPTHYYPQLMQILYVTGLTVIYYVSFYEGELVIFPVIRDQKFIDDMIQKLEAFWQSVQNFIAPEPEIKQMESEEWKELAMKWRSCQKQKRDIEIQESDLRSALVSMSGNASAKGEGLSLMKIQKRGSVKWQDIPEIQGIDLDKYRNESSIYWRINDETT